MRPESADSPVEALTEQILGAMWSLKATAMGVAAIAFSLQAFKWLAGFRLPGGDENAAAGRSPSDDPDKPAVSPRRKDGDDSVQTKPGDSVTAHDHQDRQPLPESESFSSSREAQDKGLMSSPANDAVPRNSRALADHPLLGSVYDIPSADSPASKKIVASKQNETDTAEPLLPMPETPKRKTRVKRITFELPDANGHYSDHKAAGESRASVDNAFAHQPESSSDPALGDARASVDSWPSMELKADHKHSPISPNDSQDLPKSAYADNSVDWGMPPFGQARHLANIPEEPGLGTFTRRLRKNPSVSSRTDDEDPTPFSSTQDDLMNAPTEAGDALTDEQVGNALAEIGQQLPPRRHSRSFSEPNLAAISAKQQQLNKDPELQSVLRTGLGEDESDASPDYFRTVNGDEAALDHSHERDQTGNDGPIGSHAQDSKHTNGNEAHPLLRLEIITGPSRGQIFTIDSRTMLVTIGRLPDNEVTFNDNEVSSHHAELQWCAKRKCWLARDLGSLNGTRLNGNFISNAARKPGKTWKLNSDDILLLGHRTSIKVAYLPNTDLPTVHSNLKLYAPPSGLQPCVTIKSEQIANLRAELGIEKTVQEKQLRLEVACVCHVGAEHKRRGKDCEDVPFLGESGRSGAALYCIFDGHCGSSSSQQSKHLLPENLRRHMRDLQPRLGAGEGLGSAWEDVFLETDQGLKTEDGCTATAALVWKDSAGDICIQTANVGDSAAVFWRTSDHYEDAQQLTTDHRISEPAERQRLASIGIELTPGSDRLYGLNVARCLGDHYLKDFGFSAVPSVSEVVKLRPDQSALLVLASDGLWDVADSAQVIKTAAKAQQQPSSSTESIAQAIFQLAMDRRSRDDVTIIVLNFGSEGGESSFAINGT